MKNIAWLALTAILESLQLIIIIALIYSFIPIPADSTISTIFPFMRKGIIQKRDLFFYRIFVGSAIALQAALVYRCRKFLNDGKPLDPIRAWIVMAVIILVPQLFLVYQIWLGPHPEQARRILCAVCAAAVLVRIFWPEVHAWTRGISKFRPRLAVPFKGKAFWKHIPLCMLTTALTIQIYLYGFAVYGWYAHQPLWPSPDPWIYAVLAVTCTATNIIMVLFASHKAPRDRDARAITEGLLAFFLLNALFKLQVYYYQPILAQKVYVVLLAVSVVVKLGWPLIERFIRAASGLLMDEGNRPALTIMINAGFLFFIVLFLYVPDMESAIARVFMGEQFHAIDACLMNTGWAYHAGCRLDVDVNNRYGLGMAVIASQLSNLLGGFSYLNVYTLVMLACMVYFILAYGLLRWWLNSIPIAMAGVLILFKMQPFHDETASFYLTNPSTTVCRYFFDLPFLWMALLFLRTSRKVFLALAAATAAVAVFYALDTGVYLAAAFYALLIGVYILKETRAKLYRGPGDLGFAAALCLIPPLGAVALLRLTQGPAVLTGTFWKNMTEYIHSQMWFGPVPIWENLRVHDYWIFCLAMWIILSYVFTMIFIGSLVYTKKISRENLFVAVVCVYGLAILNYFINRSEPGSAYVCIMPYVFILCFWVRRWAGRLSTEARKKFYLAFLGLCLYALWTTHLTIAYPNVFNFSRNPAVDPMVAPKLSEGRLGYFNQLFIQYPDAFKLPVNSLGETFEDWRTEDDFSSDEQLKAYFRQEFDFSEDAALIDGLTGHDEPAALISSFEIQMLIQADRRPFFYIFPLVNSRPMRMRLFEVTHMWTTTQQDDTVKQLQDQKPPYVFMERIYLAPEIPAAYLYDMPAVCALVNYVRVNYEPYKIGKYLVAMKRKVS